MAAQRLQDLMNPLPQQGTLEWLGWRQPRLRQGRQNSPAIATWM